MEQHHELEKRTRALVIVQNTMKNAFSEAFSVVCCFAYDVVAPPSPRHLEFRHFSVTQEFRLCSSPLKSKLRVTTEFRILDELAGVAVE